MRANKYLHLLNGQPAHYNGEQIIYAEPWRAVPVANSLEQVESERAAAEQWRQQEGLAIAPTSDYGYMLLVIEE